MNSISVLHEYIKIGNTQMVKEYLSNNDLQLKETSNYEFCLAIKYNRFEILRILYEHDKNCFEIDNKRILDLAIKNGQFPIISLLLRYIDIRHYNYDDFFTYSIKNHKNNLFEYLEEIIPESWTIKDKLIRRAIYYGNNYILKHLLNKYPTKIRENKTIKLAIKKDRKDIIRWLFNENLIKIDHKEIKLIDMLLELMPELIKYININEKLCVSAAYHGNLKLLKLFFEINPNIDPNYNKQEMYRYALYYEHKDIFEWLKEKFKNNEIKKFVYEYAIYNGKRKGKELIQLLEKQMLRTFHYYILFIYAFGKKDKIVLKWLKNKKKNIFKISFVDCDTFYLDFFLKDCKKDVYDFLDNKHNYVKDWKNSKYGKKSDINPFSIAACHGNYDIIKYIEDTYENSNTICKAEIYITAFKRGSKEIMKMVYDEIGLINTIEWYKIFSRGSYYSNKEIKLDKETLDLSIKLGQQISRGKEYMEMFICAIINNKLEIAKWLLEYDKKNKKNFIKYEININYDKNKEIKEESFKWLQDNNFCIIFDSYYFGIDNVNITNFKILDMDLSFKNYMNIHANILIKSYLGEENKLNMAIQKAIKERNVEIINDDFIDYLIVNNYEKSIKLLGKVAPHIIKRNAKKYIMKYPININIKIIKYLISFIDELKLSDILKRSIYESFDMNQMDVLRILVNYESMKKQDIIIIIEAGYFEIAEYCIVDKNMMEKMDFDVENIIESLLINSIKYGNVKYIEYSMSLLMKCRKLKIDQMMRKVEKLMVFYYRKMY